MMPPSGRSDVDAFRPSAGVTASDEFHPQVSADGVGRTRKGAQGQRRVAFLPGVPLTFKALRKKDYSEAPKILGEHLKKRRRELGLVQREVGKQMGVSAETVANWEKGKTKPVASQFKPVLDQAAQYLGWDEGSLRRYLRGKWRPSPGGRVQLMISSYGMYKGQVDAGRVRIVAILGSTRHPALPDVPTAIEQGSPDLVVTSWQGVLAPANTDSAIIDKLESAYRQAAAAPGMKTLFEGLGYFPIFRGRKETADLILKDTAKWSAIINGLNIRLD